MSNNLTIYDAEYWATRYRESLTDDSVFRRLAAEVDAKRGDSLLAKTVEHWKKLADQPTRPASTTLFQSLRSYYGICDTHKTPHQQNRLCRNWTNTGIACSDKCSSHPCPCGHPERHCKGCSGDPGSTHEAHQTAASFDACSVCNPKQKLDHLPEGSH